MPLPIVVQYCRIFPERNAEVPAGAFGTRPVSPTNKDVRILTESIEGGPDLSPESDASAAFGYADHDHSGKTYGGQLTSKCRVDELPSLFLPFFGKVVTTGAGPDYTHAFQPLDDLTQVAPSIGIDAGIEKKREYRFSGVLVDELTISKTGAGEVNLVYTVIAKDRAEAAYDGAYNPSFSQKGKLQAVQTATLFGTAVVWENITMRMKRNWDPTKAFSSTTLPDAEIGRFEVDISGTFKYEVNLGGSPTTAIGKFEAGTEGEFTIEFRGAAIGANFEKLIVELDRVRLVNVGAAHLNGTERKLENVTIRGLVPTSGDWCKVTVVNDVATPASYP